MSYLEGVYWDLDGTIANTELEAHLPAFNRAFVELGLDWYWDQITYIDLLKINGGKNRIAFYAKSQRHNISKEFIFKIHKEKQKHYLNLIRKGAVKLKTGVKRLVDELSLNNVKQFIVTSSSRSQVSLLLEMLFNKTDPFEFCISSEDVELHKPHPLPYLKAISLSGLKQSNTIVFEDSLPGLRSSLSAKLPTICVKSNIPTNFDDDINPLCYVDTIGDEDNKSKILLGPKLNGNFINFEYLSSVLKII